MSPSELACGNALGARRLSVPISTIAPRTRPVSRRQKRSSLLFPRRGKADPVVAMNGCQRPRFAHKSRSERYDLMQVTHARTIRRPS